MTIKDRVYKLTKHYNTNDPFELAEAAGVILVKYPLEHIRGYYHYFQQCNIIYIDEGLPEHEQRLICAHELGHMFLHKKTNAFYMNTKTHFKTSAYEIEANTFAMELLVLDETLLENINLTVDQLSRLLGYNKALIELRLKNFKV